jgi:hypothetical protein
MDLIELCSVFGLRSSGLALISLAPSKHGFGILATELGMAFDLIGSDAWYWLNVCRPTPDFLAVECRASYQRSWNLSWALGLSRPTGRSGGCADGQWYRPCIKR